MLGSFSLVAPREGVSSSRFESRPEPAASQDPVRTPIAEKDAGPLKGVHQKCSVAPDLPKAAYSANDLVADSSALGCFRRADEMTGVAFHLHLRRAAKFAKHTLVGQGFWLSAFSVTMFTSFTPIRSGMGRISGIWQDRSVTYSVIRGCGPLMLFTASRVVTYEIGRASLRHHSLVH